MTDCVCVVFVGKYLASCVPESRTDLKADCKTLNK